jgi:hypothetical protein
MSFQTISRTGQTIDSGTITRQAPSARVFNAATAPVAARFELAQP